MTFCLGSWRNQKLHNYLHSRCAGTCIPCLCLGSSTRGFFYLFWFIFSSHEIDTGWHGDIGPTYYFDVLFVDNFRETITVIAFGSTVMLPLLSKSIVGSYCCSIHTLPLSTFLLRVLVHTIYTRRSGILLAFTTCRSSALQLYWNVSGQLSGRSLILRIW